MTEHYNVLDLEGLHTGCKSCRCEFKEDKYCGCGCHKTYLVIKDICDGDEYLARESIKISISVQKGLISHEEYQRRLAGILKGKAGLDYARKTGYYINPPTGTGGLEE